MSLIQLIAQKEQERGEHGDFEYKFWKPNPGEIIQGVVDKMGSTITDYGESDYIELDTCNDGKFTIFLNQILVRQVEEEKVTRGDTIGIKYLGLVKSKKSSREYKDYVLVKDTGDYSKEEKKS